MHVCAYCGLFHRAFLFGSCAIASGANGHSSYIDELQFLYNKVAGDYYDPRHILILVTTAGGAIVTPINQQPVFRVQPLAMVRLLLLGVLALLLFFAAILLSTPDSRWLVETKRRRAMWLVLAGSYLLLPILLVLTASGCSGGSSASTTPPPTTRSTPAGTYTLTVLATANGKSQSTSLTPIVQ